MVLWQRFISNIVSDGFIGDRDEYYRIKEMLHPIVFLALTEQVHPVTALKTAFENFEFLELLYYKKIAPKDFVEQLSVSNNKIVLDDKEDPQLWNKYIVLFHGLMGASAIMKYHWDMDYDQVVAEFAQHDIWADIACNGRKMCSANPWDIGDSLVRFIYGDDGYTYTKWNDIYQDTQN